MSTFKKSSGQDLTTLKKRGTFNEACWEKQVCTWFCLYKNEGSIEEGRKERKKGDMWGKIIKEERKGTCGAF